MKNETTEKWTNETITISRDEFAQCSAELLAKITLACAKECSDDEELKTLFYTDKLLVQFTSDLMHKLFNEKTLQIEKEEK